MDVQTPEPPGRLSLRLDVQVPPNTLAELRRNMARRRLISDRIRQIEMLASSISHWFVP
jgi:hypothetical protein